MTIDSLLSNVLVVQTQAQRIMARSRDLRRDLAARLTPESPRAVSGTHEAVVHVIKRRAYSVPSSTFNALYIRKIAVKKGRKR